MSIRVTGQQALIRRLKEFGQEGEQIADHATGVAANEIALEASNLAPVNFGTLKQSISASKVSDFNWQVNANVKYAAYVEFGTGTFVQVPEEWKDIAWAYYVNGQGYMRPKPYLYPAYVRGIREYKTSLQIEINRLVNRFNRN